MDMAFGIQKDIVRLDIPVHDSLRVNVSDRTTKLCNPKAHGVLGECLSRDMEPKIAAIHQVHDDISVPCQP